MHRFYCSTRNISWHKIIIKDPGQVHHLRDVLRLKIGDEVTVFDDKRNEYSCLIEKILSKEIVLKIKEKRNFTPKKELHLTVACAIPKRAKMDDIVDKLTQLGVGKIIPLITERVIIRLDKTQKIARQKRWEKIAQSASLQSQRNTIPIIEPITDIKEVLSKGQDFDLKLIPTLIDERKILKEVFKDSYPKNILLLIGPEGDFTSGEIALAKKAGCIPVSFGRLVLRVDTAAIAATTFIRFYESR